MSASAASAPEDFGEVVQQGDVVLRLGAAPVQTVSELQAELSTLQPKSRVILHLARDRRDLRLEVELGEVRSGVTP